MSAGAPAEYPKNVFSGQSRNLFMIADRGLFLVCRSSVTVTEIFLHPFSYFIN
jgi:hypothetical protein